MTTGERIKKRRKELGMSVEDLAKKTGKHIATVYRWERGDIDDWPVETLIAISHALDTSPANLMGEPEFHLVYEWTHPEEARRNEIFEKYGALMSALDTLSEDDRKEVENFIKFKTSQSDE